MKKFNDIISTYNKNHIGLCGMTDEFFCAYISKMFKESDENILILTSTLYEANKLFISFQNYVNNTYLFPMDDFLTSESIAISPELKITRLETLNELCSSEKHIVITHLDAFLRFLPSKRDYLSSVINIKVNEVYSREQLIEDLYSIGYTRETIVSNTGEMGIRGYIIDVFPINYEYPIRIEFFDDEIESIRFFDVENQKSLKEIEMVTINPYTEFLIKEKIDISEIKQKDLPLYTDNYCNILGYMDNVKVIVKDYNQLKTSYLKLQNDIEEYSEKNKLTNNKFIFNFEEYIDKFNIYYNTIDNKYSNIKEDNIYNANIKKVDKFNENIELINKFINENIIKGKTIIICLKDYQIKNVINNINEEYVLTDFDNIFDNRVNIVKKGMNEGFICNDYIFLTANELFNNKVNILKYKSKYKYSSKIKNINSLEIGDYIVHSINGIGVYNGIKTLKKNDLEKDYLEILYAGSDKLYIPVEKIDLISKYTGKEGIVPKIHKLGSSEWAKTKIRVKEKVKDIANKLIQLYAERSMQKGFQFSHDDEWQLMFEKEFEFTETKDQLLAISQIKKDMESISPMDRLLCGDVGYGKTEVAFRAMFKAVNDSKQVMYLCPTTILSKQQCENAQERFKNFPVNIAILNRFTSIKDTKKILKDFNEGYIDILFGTHRILSDDVKPKNLGLLIIDEEQRFGVTHKEKMKSYKKNVDVLTLTATPIPRTLQMSLVGLRSLSLIETPPVDRYPVQTYVIEENSQLIKEAIYKEMSRNGQVYILFNNVERIEEKMYEIQKLVPEAKIVYAHGKLNKDDLENRMLDFINYKYDILLCTTIIETGIDIPNVNTLIVLDADRFGLSQLYQIRGRVGRSNKIAYAYLMYSKNKTLNEIAVKRLSAIKEFTELGSGFSIANRDLSIRGAGDILGSEQAGFIDSVGIDLYLKILNDEVKRLKGEEIEEESTEQKSLIEVDTHISNQYVEENELKIEVHKLINKIDSKEKLDEIKLELEDRFGKLDEKNVIYMHEEWFEKLAKKLDIISVKQDKKLIELIFNKNISNRIDGEKIFMDALNISRNFSFRYKNEFLILLLDTSNLEKHYLYYINELLDKIELKNIE